MAKSKLMSTVLTVVVFAIAFAYVEASVVVYLRHLSGAMQPTINKNEILWLFPGIVFLEPKTAIKLITNSQLLQVEQFREAATLVMLATVAFLAGKKLRTRIGYFFLAFGIWDIFYYVFLRLILGWPARLTDLDIFFLLPTPWVGPVFVPLIISSLLIFGSLVVLFFT